MDEEERPAPPLALALFGPFDVRLQGQPLRPLRSQKSQWLLALLALQRGRAVARAWLAGTLWPESSARQAAFNLSRNLTDLRHMLGPEARRLDAPTTRTLRLDLVGAEADVLIFDEAITCGDPTSLERAVALHRGPLLQGCHEEWLLPERQAREEAYLAALERLAAHARGRGDLAAAAHYLRQLVAADPLRESGQRALMELLAAGGEFAAATQVYRELRLLLHRELNAAPDPETIASYAQIRAQVRRRLVEPAAPPVAVLPRAAAPARAEPPSRLPRPLTRLVGREHEAREIQARLTAERLVTLTGPGGVGKTRLAIQVAQEIAADYRDGVWFVDLARLANPALVPQAVAAALAVREQLHGALTETLQKFLGAKELLLLLDNCEHLLPACAELAEALLSACSGLRILATSRQSLGLTGEVVWPVPGLSLPGPEARETLRRTPGALLQSEAVRLFVERGRAATPGFSLTECNAESVAQICRQLDGLPLSIELAAARLKILPADEIAARLEDRFSFLTGGSRTAAPRHQTLRATMDWSYQLLSEPERTLLRRLSVFAGGWTLEAAEAVCGDVGSPGRVLGPPGGGRVPAQRVDAPPGRDHPSSGRVPGPGTQGGAREAGPRCAPPPGIQHAAVLDLMAQLVDKSLVLVEPQEGAGGAEGASTHFVGTRGPGPGRYRLLETVRQYAVEQLRAARPQCGPSEEEAVRRQHLEFHLRLAERAAPYLGLFYWARTEQDAWLIRLDPEHDNLRGALDWALLAAPGEALLLAGALAGYWEGREHLAEGRQWLAAALERAGPGRRSLAGAAALDGASALALLQSDRDCALALHTESRAIRRELADRTGMATALTHLARIALTRGDYSTARALYEDSLAIQKELGDQAGIAAVLWGLGHVARRAGEYQEARLLLAESLAIRRALGDREGISESLVGLGDAVLALGDAAAARTHFDEALAICRDLGCRTGVAGALSELSEAARQQGEYAEARRLREESFALWRAIGSRVPVLHSLGALGHLAREQGEYRDARNFYAESLRLRHEMGDPYTIAQSLEDFAELAAAEQQWTRMVRLLGAAQALRDAFDTPLPPREQAGSDRLLTAARRALGEGAVGAAWAEGRALTLEQAVCAALEEAAVPQTP